MHPFLCLVRELFRMMLWETEARKAMRESRGWCRWSQSPSWEGRVGGSGVLPLALDTSSLREVLGWGLHSHRGHWKLIAQLTAMC